MSNKKLFLFFFLIIVIFCPASSKAGNLPLNEVYLGLENVASDLVAPGSEFAVAVYLNAKDPINAFDLEIVYDKKNLEFLSFDNTSSIVNIWQPTPRVLPNGNIGLSGGIIKAFSGEKGLLIKLFFKAMSVGQPEFPFVKSDLYIADGKGTKIEAYNSYNIFSIKEGGKMVSAPVVPFKTTPENIIIEKELENFKSQIESQAFLKKNFTPLLIFMIIIFVFCSFGVYNRLKRKQ